MSHDAAITALKKYSKVDADDVPPTDLVKILKDESDRGTIILAVTIVDDALTGALKRRMSHLDPKKELNPMFDMEGGLLATFSNRIKLAHAFRILDSGSRALFDLLRVMRNSAAHARQETTFDTPVIQRGLERLMELDERQDPSTWDRHMRRDLFCLVCAAMADSVSQGHPDNALVPSKKVSKIMTEVVRDRVGARLRAARGASILKPE